MNTEMLQEEVLGDGVSACPTEGNETIFFFFIYIYIYRHTYI